MTEPIPAHRSEPGVFYLASETVEVGMRFQAEGALYEVTTELTSRLFAPPLLGFGGLS